MIAARVLQRLLGAAAACPSKSAAKVQVCGPHQEAHQVRIPALILGNAPKMPVVDAVNEDGDATPDAVLSASFAPVRTDAVHILQSASVPLPDGSGGDVEMVSLAVGNVPIAEAPTEPAKLTESAELTEPRQGDANDECVTSAGDSGAQEETPVGSEDLSATESNATSSSPLSPSRKPTNEENATETTTKNWVEAIPTILHTFQEKNCELIDGGWLHTTSAKNGG